MTHRHPLPLRRLLAAATAAVLAGALASPLAAAAATGVPTDPNDGVPRVDPPVTYAKFEPLADPGRGSADYFQPKWYDTDGRHIQAHGGQVVTTQEDGQTVYYWYGEDRTNGYWNSPGVAVYRSTDAMNWTNLGDALRSITTRDDLLTPYFENLYDTVDENGQPRNEKIDALAYHLNSQRSADYTAIFERPKVLHNDATGQWVMWWHADGRTEPGGSTYARSMAAVAVSDSPTGPFRMVGAYRMPNRTDYKGCSQYAVPGQARDMTVFQDDDGKAYISYSSEENSSLYIAELDDSYTNVVKTTDSDTLDVHQYSEDGRYPYVFADGTADAPVRGEDFQIVKECGYLEAPAIFERDGTYTAIASGATGGPRTRRPTTPLRASWARGSAASRRAMPTRTPGTPACPTVRTAFSRSATRTVRPSARSRPTSSSSSRASSSTWATAGTRDSRTRPTSGCRSRSARTAASRCTTPPPKTPRATATAGTPRTGMTRASATAPGRSPRTRCPRPCAVEPPRTCPRR